MNPKNIQVFGSSTAEDINPDAKIVIISYQLLANEVMINKFEKREKGNFLVAIAD